ncbi:MAG: SDR family oxidoreductase [Cyclobacteriaceae bacterium]
MGNKKTISILGCGWLGLPLARAFSGEGYMVRGSTTRAEKLNMLEAEGIIPYLIRLSPELNADHNPDFFRSDILIVNIPPGRRREDVETFYPAQVRAVLEQQPSSKILFVSSTSVYPDLNRVVTEADSLTPAEADGRVRSSGKALLLGEQLIEKYSAQATILRFSGLMGLERHPGRFLAGKKLDSNGKAPVNFIHLDDCVAIIQQLVQQEVWGEIFNACADAHPTKAKFYEQASEKLGLAPPEFNPESELSYKQVSGEKLKQRLSYQYIHPNPMDMI